MRLPIIYIWLGLIWSGLLMALLPTVGQAQSADETVIRKLLDEESTTFFANNYEAYAKLWADAPYVSYTFPVGNNQYQRFVGAGLRAGFKQILTGTPSGRTSTKSNVSIRVHGDSASAIFDDEIKDAAGKQLVIFHLQRYFEKENGLWKIVQASTY